MHDLKAEKRGNFLPETSIVAAGGMCWICGGGWHADGHRAEIFCYS